MSQQSLSNALQRPFRMPCKFLLCVTSTAIEFVEIRRVHRNFLQVNKYGSHTRGLTVLAHERNQIGQISPLKAGPWQACLPEGIYHLTAMGPDGRHQNRGVHNVREAVPPDRNSAT